MQLKTVTWWVKAHLIWIEPRRIQSVEEDKASLAETFNQKETAACGYEFNNNIVRGKRDLVCRIEEDESDVLKQGLSSESRSTENTKKKLVSKATGDSAQNTVGSSYEMKEGINSSKGTCCEAKWLWPGLLWREFYISLRLPDATTVFLKVRIMTSEKRAQKLHADDKLLSWPGWCFWSA